MVGTKESSWEGEIDFSGRLRGMWHCKQEGSTGGAKIPGEMTETGGERHFRDQVETCAVELHGIYESDPSRDA